MPSGLAACFFALFISPLPLCLVKRVHCCHLSLMLIIRPSFILMAAAERECSSEQGEKGALGHGGCGVGWLLKLEAAFGQRAEGAPPPPVQTSSLENITWG